MPADTVGRRYPDRDPLRVNIQSHVFAILFHGLSSLLVDLCLLFYEPKA